jgi:hypothetical protein
MKISTALLKYLSSLILSLFFMSSCQSQTDYDPDLMTPDNDANGVNHGFNYTKLGCLLAYPWKYNIVIIDTTGEKKMYNGKTIKEIKEELYFELQKDRTLKYWFTSDYLVSPIDTVILADGNTSITINRLASKDLKLRHIYSNGKWEANFKDSTITIDFGKNDFGLTPIKGKYNLLTAEYLSIFEGPIDFTAKSEAEKKKKREKYHQFVHY